MVFSSSVIPLSGSPPVWGPGPGVRSCQASARPDPCGMPGWAVDGADVGACAVPRFGELAARFGEAAEPDLSTALKVWITLARLRLGRVARHGGGPAVCSCPGMGHTPCAGAYGSGRPGGYYSSGLDSTAVSSPSRDVAAPATRPNDREERPGGSEPRSRRYLSGISR